MRRAEREDMAFGEGVRGAALQKAANAQRATLCPAIGSRSGDPFSVSPKVRQHAVKTAFTVLSPHASLFHLRPACAGGPLQAATMPLSHEGTDEHASGFRRFMFLRRIFGTTRVKGDSAILSHSRDSRRSTASPRPGILYRTRSYARDSTRRGWSRLPWSSSLPQTFASSHLCV